MEFVHTLRSSGIYLNKLLLQKNQIPIQTIEQKQKITILVKEYRKKVGSKTRGIKLYKELKYEFTNQDIKIGRD